MTCSLVGRPCVTRKTHSASTTAKPMSAVSLAVTATAPAMPSTSTCFSAESRWLVASRAASTASQATAACTNASGLTVIPCSRIAGVTDAPIPTTRAVGREQPTSTISTKNPAAAAPSQPVFATRAQVRGSREETSSQMRYGTAVAA